MVLQYEIPFYLLDKIYEENDIIKEVIDDYNYAVQNFTPINNINSIKNPLLTIYQSNDTFERYLTAIYEIQNSREEVTTRSIANVLNLKETHSVRDFFKRHEKIINDYVSIEDVLIGKPNKYSLTNKGLEVVKLMYHFRDYYKSL